MSLMSAKSKLLPKVFVANEQGHYGVTRPITADEMIQAATTLLGQRFLKTICLNEPSLTQDFIEAQLPNREQEAFCVIFLDDAYRLVKYERFFSGSFKTGKGYLLEIMRWALSYSATKIVVGHRHSLEEYDKEFKEECELVTSLDSHIVHALERILPEFDMKLLDYVVIFNQTVASYFQQVKPDLFEGRYPSTEEECSPEDDYERLRV